MCVEVFRAVVIPLLAISIITCYSSYHSVMGLVSRRWTTTFCLGFESNFAVICSKYCTTHLRSATTRSGQDTCDHAGNDEREDDELQHPHEDLSWEAEVLLVETGQVGIFSHYSPQTDA